MVFVVDSSTKPAGITGSAAWQSMLLFVNRVISRLFVGPNAVRVAFVRYADSSDVPLPLYYNYDQLTARQNILTISYWGGGSNLAGALDTARTQALSSGNVRSGVPRVIIIVTDLLIYSSQQLIDAANAVKSAGITIIGVGINSSGQLNSLALYQVSTNNETFVVSDYTSLQALDIPVAELSCVPPSKLNIQSIPLSVFDAGFCLARLTAINFSEFTERLDEPGLSFCGVR